MRLIHNPQSVTCPLCNKPFKTKLYLKRHLVSFHELSVADRQRQEEIYQHQVKVQIQSGHQQSQLSHRSSPTTLGGAATVSIPSLSTVGNSNGQAVQSAPAQPVACHVGQTVSQQQQENSSSCKAGGNLIVATAAPPPRLPPEEAVTAEIPTESSKLRGYQSQVPDSASYVEVGQLPTDTKSFVGGMIQYNATYH